MAPPSPAQWGFACKFSVTPICSARDRGNFSSRADFLPKTRLASTPTLAEQMPKDLSPDLPKSLASPYLPNSAFRSFGEVTQNFRANRRWPVNVPKKCSKCLPQRIWMPSREQKQVPEYGFEPDEPERPQVQTFIF